MLIPVFSIIAENVQQKTRAPAGISGAASVLITVIGATLPATCPPCSAGRSRPSRC
jgi:hypothetical protein